MIILFFPVFLYCIFRGLTETIAYLWAARRVAIRRLITVSSIKAGAMGAEGAWQGHGRRGRIEGPTSDVCTCQWP